MEVSLNHLDYLDYSHEVKIKPTNPLDSPSFNHILDIPTVEFTTGEKIRVRVYDKAEDQIIRIIWYLNSLDQILLFVFAMRSICDFRIIYEYQIVVTEYQIVLELN